MNHLSLRAFVITAAGVVKHAAIALLASAVLSFPLSASDDAPYSPKIITMIVGVPGGSGADVAARTLAREWSKHIPGNPYIVVKNLEGAGGSAALNFVYEKARPDGLTVYYGSWNPLDVLEGGKGIRFIPENFAILGSGSSMRGTIVRTDSVPGYTGPIDLLKAERIKVGGRSAGNVNDLIGNLALEILGVDYKFVAGYRGMSTIATSMYGREVQAGHIGSGGFARFFRETTANGETAIAYFHPFFDRNGNEVGPIGSMAGAASFSEVYQQVHGSRPSGPYWEAYKWLRFNAHGSSPAVLAPPGTPDSIVTVLRSL